MTRLRLIPSHETPPDDGSGSGMGFRFTHPETGHKTQSRSKGEWLAKIIKYRKDNDLPVPDDMEAIAEDQLCQLLPAGLCRYESGEDAKPVTSGRVSVTDVVNGTKVLMHWMLNGQNVVSQAEADARGRTCSNCYFNIPVSGCAACKELLTHVYTAKGQRGTAYDANLDTKSCALCKCSSAAHIWVPIESLALGVSDSLLTKFPEFCWKARGIRELIERRAAVAV